MFSAVIVCAGASTRMNVNKNKTMLPLDGKPMFMHSVDLFKNYTDDVILVTDSNSITEVLKYHKNVYVGGSNRAESVYLGIKNAKYDDVLIHDGARPLLSSFDLEKMIEVIPNGVPTFLGHPLVNSIKDAKTYDHVSRDDFVEAYTPQYVKKSDYIAAYLESLKDACNPTDDVTLISKYLGKEIKMVTGSRKNIKVTTMDDYLAINNGLRIGHSFDIHELVIGRPLYLGGIQIPHDKGLLGHSDGDALLHAISESLLGALSLGDLGHFYPDNDPDTLGIDSKIILKDIYELIIRKGYYIGNIDTMVFLEEPHLAPHILKIRESIASLLGIDVGQISVKATTFEHLGPIGDKKAIGASSTVLLFQK